MIIDERGRGASWKLEDRYRKSLCGTIEKFKLTKIFWFPLLRFNVLRLITFSIFLSNPDRRITGLLSSQVAQLDSIGPCLMVDVNFIFVSTTATTIYLLAKTYKPCATS